MPRRFFDRHVMPNYEDWLASPLDERLAKNAVAEANNMAALFSPSPTGRNSTS
jgi:hypothetical protein